MSPELRAVELGRFSEIMDSRRHDFPLPRAKSDDDDDWDDEEFEDEDEEEDDEDFDDDYDDDLDDSEEDVPVERRKHRDDDDEY